MIAAPDFLQFEHEFTSGETFRPSPPLRGTERLVWYGVGIVAAYILFVFTRTGELSFLMILFLVALLFIVSVISFGNWIDRSTAIVIDPATVHFHSPLRDILFRFDQIESLWAIPAVGGWRIRVRGSGRYFQFRTLSVLRKREEGDLRLGIEGGERLAGTIRSRAGLSAPVEEGGAWVCHKP